MTAFNYSQQQQQSTASGAASASGQELNYVFIGKPFNPLIPEGLYEAVITSIKEETFNNGQTCVVIEWTIMMPEAYKGRTVKDFFSIYDNDANRKAREIGALYELVEGLTGSPKLQLWSQLLRKMAAIKLGHRTNKKTNKSIHYVVDRIPKGSATMVAPLPQPFNAPDFPFEVEEDLSRF